MTFFALFCHLTKLYYFQVFGVVFVVDSCNTERLSETKDVLQKVIEHEKIAGKPFLM